MSRVRVFVPCDSAARSVGADDVAVAVLAEAAARGLDVELVRNGSRGMFWLEPLVEVETWPGASPSVRSARTTSPACSTQDSSVQDRSGRIAGCRSAGCRSAGCWSGRRSPARAGADRGPPVAGAPGPPHLRSGRRDRSALAERLRGARRTGRPARSAGARRPSDRREGDRVRAFAAVAGAGFPTGIKWRTVAEAPATPKFVCCNADEGDSGTFADRMLMEGDPFTLIEGMIIAAIAVGATEGFVYIRSEYPDAVATMRRAIAVGLRAGLARRERRWAARTVSTSTSGSAPAPTSAGRRPRCWRASRASAGWCGPKPPLPALEGPVRAADRRQQPARRWRSVPTMLADGGAEFYRDFGVGRSRGTQVFQLAGNVKHGGIVETAFGITLGELVDDFGGGTASAGRCVRCRSAARWARTSRPRASTCRWTTRRSRRRRHGRATAASSCSTTPSTWARRRGSRWSSAPRSRAASARRAGSGPTAASRSSTRSSSGSTLGRTPRTWCSCRTSASS